MTPWWDWQPAVGSCLPGSLHTLCRAAACRSGGPEHALAGCRQYAAWFLQCRTGTRASRHHRWVLQPAAPETVHAEHVQFDVSCCTVSAGAGLGHPKPHWQPCRVYWMCKAYLCEQQKTDPLLIPQTVHRLGHCNQPRLQHKFGKVM